MFTKPITGAKEQGVSGFFKGLGKGAIGLVARPATGLVDFTSDTFDAVKRATSEGEDANRIRPPRFFTSDNILRPYSLTAARGHKIFKELDKGKYALTDTFAHCEEVFPNKEFLILTNNRVMYTIKNETFANFGVSLIIIHRNFEILFKCLYSSASGRIFGTRWFLFYQRKEVL